MYYRYMFHVPCSNLRRNTVEYLSDQHDRSARGMVKPSSLWHKSRPRRGHPLSTPYKKKTSNKSSLQKGGTSCTVHSQGTQRH